VIKLEAELDQFGAFREIFTDITVAVASLKAHKMAQPTHMLASSLALSALPNSWHKNGKLHNRKTRT
jgi:hypothetical protein